MQYADMENPIETLRSLGVSDRTLKMHLTGIVHDIAAWTDLETALRFAVQFGGKRLYVPTSPQDGRTRLKDIFPSHVLQKICDKYAGSKVEVGSGPFCAVKVQRLKAIKMLEDGHSTSAVANTLRISRNSVASWKRMYVTPFRNKPPVKPSNLQADA